MGLRRFQGFYGGLNVGFKRFSTDFQSDFKGLRHSSREFQQTFMRILRGLSKRSKAIPAVF